jgi:CDP-4-dehydro-6-deoxyglucose reductase
VLDTLLRAGVPVPHSCRAGACQSCLLRATSATPLPAWQAGLKPALVTQNCFLACVARPDTDIAVELPGAGLRTEAIIVEISRLSATVLRVILATGEPHGHRAGQYLTLFRKDGLARSYSIASLPEEPTLELHVRIVPNGEMSQWLAGKARPGDSLEVQGPAGNCFYTADNPHQPLLLAGTGTGLAPLYGIVRDALAQNHQSPIWLYHGALNDSGLYLEAELRALASANAYFHYHPAPFHTHGPLPELLAKNHPNLKQARGFVCGDPGIVNQLKKRLFLAGMPSREILSDAFLPSPTSS